MFLTLPAFVLKMAKTADLEKYIWKYFIQWKRGGVVEAGITLKDVTPI